MVSLIARKTYQVILQHTNGLKTWEVRVAPIQEPFSQSTLSDRHRTLRSARIEAEKIIPDIAWVTGRKGYITVKSETHIGD